MQIHMLTNILKEMESLRKIASPTVFISWKYYQLVRKVAFFYRRVFHNDASLYKHET